MRLLNILARILLAAMLALVITGAIALVVLHSRGMQLLSVQTGSMAPTFRAGDALIVEPAQQLHIGSVIAYQSPRNQHVVITHRLIAQNHQTGQLTTAGDALHSPDQPFPPSLVVGQATAVAPKLGKVLDVLHQPLGLAVGVYLPATLVIITEAVHLSRRYRQPAYLLDYRYGTKSS